MTQKQKLKIQFEKSTSRYKTKQKTVSKILPKIDF